MTASSTIVPTSPAAACTGMATVKGPTSPGHGDSMPKFNYQQARKQAEEVAPEKAEDAREPSPEHAT